METAFLLDLLKQPAVLRCMAVRFIGWKTSALPDLPEIYLSARVIAGSGGTLYL
jgi:hypothetical protein